MGKSCSLEGNLAPWTCPRQKICISPPKVMAGIIPATIKSATILVKVVVCKNTFGGDMSPLKVCVENAMGGQRDCVPAQRCFYRLATFGGDKHVAAESVVARPPVCCSDTHVMPQAPVLLRRNDSEVKEGVVGFQ